MYGRFRHYNGAMPLFKRRGRSEGRREAVATAASLVSESQLLLLLAGAFIQGKKENPPLAVVSVVAQLLPAERLRPGEMDAAVHALLSELRPDDVVAVLGDGCMVAVIASDAPGAHVVAHRVAADLSVRGYDGARRKWLSGVAQVPRDGNAPQHVIQFAIDEAR